MESATTTRRMLYVGGLDERVTEAKMESATTTRRMLYVGGLDERVTEALLRASFLPFGELLDVQLPMDHVKQVNRGFGFVEFADEADAKDAVDNMDNAELFGRTIRVNAARPTRGKAGAALWSDVDAWFKALQQAEGGEEEGSSSSSGGAATEEAAK